MGQKVLALAGGVGGAKLALGLSRILGSADLTIVVNTGDDDVFHGLHVSPDLDTVLYTLAGLANPATGWGLREESFQALAALGQLGADTWFRLGDRDLATHIRRSELLRAGLPLSEVMRQIGASLGVAHTIAPMTDDNVQTIVVTPDGEMSFQEYFVKHECEPVIQALRFEGSMEGRPSPPFLEALAEAKAVVICPSNPFLSIDPILSLGGVREAMGRMEKVAVVSPIISGQAVKGPAAKLFQQLAGEAASSVAVARHYQGLAAYFVLDQADAELAPEIEALGFKVSVQQTFMSTEEEKVSLAKKVCDFLGVGTA